MTGSDIAWTPSREVLQAANLTAFMRHCGQGDYESLVAWSNARPEAFHDRLLGFLDFRFFSPYDKVIDESDGLPWTRWCVGGTTNVVLNCLDKWLDTPTADKQAIAWEGEEGERRSWTYRELHRDTCRFAAGLRSLGLGRGDVIGMYLPNVPEAAITLLAVARIGGIVLPMFSGFGGDAVAVRLNDGGAKAIVTVDGSPRRGKVVGAKSVVDGIAASVPSLKHVIVARHREAPLDWVAGRDHWWDDLTRGAPDDAPTEAMVADAPFLLIYTSGTTGKPKGVVHSHCGFPVKTALDLGICMDFRADDRILWMSDMGWLVGPILVYGTTLLGGTMVLVEGAPDYPEKDRYWRLIADHRVSYLGIAPTVVRSLMPAGEAQLEPHDLSCLRVFTSTGEPWDIASWTWLFEKVGKRRLPLLNYSGGTEVGGILTSIVIHPLRPCTFSGPVPGVGADVVDQSGEPVEAGTIGELVMRRPSIGLTRGLWKDRQRYLDSYWNVIPGLWVHGDFASRTADGMWIIHGRSDDTLKIAGKRTGPSEIESLLMATGKLLEAAAIGEPDDVKGTAIVCVCVPRDGETDGDGLRQVLVQAVVSGLGSPFRPKDVIFVADLPKTRNMKTMRRVIRAAYLDQDPGDLSSLVNPESIADLRAAIAAHRAARS